MATDHPVAHPGGPIVQEVGRTGAAAPPTFDFTDEERNNFLVRMRNAVLATVRSDGSPQATPVWYHWDGEVIRISSPGWARKVVNVRRDARISICVDDQVSGTYVTMFGRAEVISDDRVAPESWPILLKYLHADEAAVRWDRINAAGDRVVIRLRRARSMPSLP